VITEHTHSENNDWQESGGEQQSVSEISTPSPTVEAPEMDAAAHEAEQISNAEKTSAAAADDDKPASDQAGGHAEPPVAQISGDQTTGSETLLHAFGAAVADSANAAISDFNQPGSPGNSPSALFVLEGASPLLEQGAVRPFTDFITEFRQTEERLSALLKEQSASFPALLEGSESAKEPADLSNAETRAQAGNGVPADSNGNGQAESIPETSSAAEAPVTPPAERPVSPLLRPPTRPRLPRHVRHRIEEAAQPEEQRVEQPEPVVTQSEPAAAPPTEAAAAEEPHVEEPVRPARRYRFDRPAATASASLPTAKVHAPSFPTPAADSKEKQGMTVIAHAEGGMSIELADRSEMSGVTTSDLPEQRIPPQEAAPTSAEANAPSPSERRRRNGHERQREKEPAATTTIVPPPSASEPAALEVETVSASLPDVAIEDLPPLEYSELQAASSRRRRRRRAGSASVAATNGASASKVTPDLVAPSSPAAPAKDALASPSQAYNIVSGYTVSQMNQGNGLAGPFMGPEPSPARGSMFSPPPSLRQVRNEVLRSTPPQQVKSGEIPMMSPASVHYLANAIGQAIQTQTDRMVAELRRANQIPTNVSVSLPPFPSTERVGVFVDVANLLYSARTLRLTVDFGKLLDFLRGNRRLVRAQAYCPTSPQPGDDQMFLQAVKGLGYRITTKNYKTFSSGAKKADLDLDLCMDVVRLVEGKAVDCIVLVSGDGDFIPMLDYCSDHGVRVEVAAFDESLSAVLRQSCDLFINLSMLEEIRA
jgi:uncharacterized LabA/DUF88 family protein